ncbi:MAG: CHAD domain-containing protein [Gemmataceae bacterium]
MRGGLGDEVFHREDDRFRDAGRPLTAARDAEAVVEAIDTLTKSHAGRIEAGAFAGPHAILKARRRLAVGAVLADPRAVPAVTLVLRHSRADVRHWTMHAKGWSAIRPGLKRIYAHGRDALEAAEAPTADNFHELRKSAKHLGYAVEFLRATRPGALGQLAKRLKEMAQALGDARDLALLRRTIEATPDTFAAPGAVLAALADRRRMELESAALVLGQRIYRRKPKAFVRKIERYWHDWRNG